MIFLAADAQPQWDYSGNCWFDGKLGIWPLVFKEPVSEKEYKEKLLQKLLPIIKSKWLRSNRIQENSI